MKLLHRNVYDTKSGLRRGGLQVVNKDHLKTIRRFVTKGHRWKFLGVETVSEAGVVVFFEPKVKP